MNNKGLSMISILITVVIIGALMAIALPKYLSQTETKAKEQASVLKQVKQMQQDPKFKGGYLGGDNQSYDALEEAAKKYSK